MEEENEALGEKYRDFIRMNEIAYETDEMKKAIGCSRFREGTGDIA